MLDIAFPLRAPHGRDLNTRGWLQEAALRCLLNNLDPEVAEDPENLIVYGGRGKAARDLGSLHAIVRTLERLADDETLLVQSGKPVGVFRTLMGRRQALAVLAAALVALGVVAVPQAAPGELCFSQPGVTACVAPEFKDFWQQNGGLRIFGYPLEPAKQEDGRLVQYYERQRLELHPESAAPYTVQLGLVNVDALQREGRDWSGFAKER